MVELVVVLVAVVLVVVQVAAVAATSWVHGPPSATRCVDCLNKSTHNIVKSNNQILHICLQAFCRALAWAQMATSEAVRESTTSSEEANKDDTTLVAASASTTTSSSGAGSSVPVAFGARCDRIVSEVGHTNHILMECTVIFTNIYYYTLYVHI